MFDDKSITELWLLMLDSYPNVTEIVIRALLPFESIYLCESGSSTMLQIKTNQHSR